MSGTMTLAGLLLIASLHAAAHAAVIRVNAASDPGSVGDGQLSLTEALRLAGGDLTPAQLSPAEAAQVTALPAGAGIADRVEFALSGTIAVTGSTGAGALPDLADPGDTLDGGGNVVLSGAATPPGLLWSLRITASDVTVQGLAFEDMPASVVFVNAPLGATIAHVRLAANRVTRAGADGIRVVATGLPAEGAIVSGGTIADLVLEDNVVEASSGAINLRAAAAFGAGKVSLARLSGVTIRRNTVRDNLQGLFVIPAEGVGDFDANEIAGLTIEDNVFERQGDSSLVLAATHPAGTSVSRDNLLRDARIERNVFRGRGVGESFQGGAIFVAGGFLAGCFDTTSTPTSLRDRVSNVLIADNTVSDRGPYAFFLQAAHSCRGKGGSLTEGVLEDVTIVRNTIASSIAGLKLEGAHTFDTGPTGRNTDNTLRRVLVADNTFTDNDLLGIEVMGAYAARPDGPAAATSRNVVSDLTIRNNGVTGSDGGIVVFGTLTQSAVAEASGNLIRGLSITGNTINRMDLEGITLRPSTAGGEGRMEDNVLEGVEVVGNSVRDVGGAGVFVQAHFGTDATARRNEVRALRLAENLIEGVVRNQALNGDGVFLMGPINASEVKQPKNAIRPVTIERNTVRRVANFGISVWHTNGHTISGNTIESFGSKRPLFAKKRRNRIVGNVFGKRLR